MRRSSEPSGTLARWTAARFDAPFRDVLFASMNPAFSPSFLTVGRLTWLLFATAGAWTFAAEDVDRSKLPPAAASFDFQKEVQPLLESATVSVQAYRKLRWSGRTGLLLEAA